MNPQGLVPALELDDGTVLTQSLAIIEWLEETRPNPPLLPADPLEKARARAFALAIACEIHPVQNLKVLAACVATPASTTPASPPGPRRSINAEGLAACEKLVEKSTGGFLFGDRPGLAEIYLVPQLGNARRFGVDVTKFPRLLAAEAAAAALPAFIGATPDKQPDAE